MTLMRRQIYRNRKRNTLRVKPNFLQRHHFPGIQIFGFINNAISAFSQLFNLLKIIHKYSDTTTYKTSTFRELAVISDFKECLIIYKIYEFQHLSLMHI